MLAELEGAVTNPSRGKSKKIRCKTCRTELASYAHIMDHGQTDISTSTVAGETRPARRVHTPALNSIHSSELPFGLNSNAAVRAAMISERIMRSHAAAEGSPTQPSVLDISNVSGAMGAEIILDTVEARPAAASLTSPTHGSISSELKCPPLSLSEASPLSIITAKQHKPAFSPPSQPSVAASRRTGDAQPASASTALSGTVVVLEEPRTTPRSAELAPPIMIGPKCSGYFFEPVRSHFFYPD
ncbi:hypothetical protein FRB97_005388 [Tulasnella sp. 331]|nr:hypothetical protein FRB97_005388 [Tulasnella sp. 331]